MPAAAALNLAPEMSYHHHQITQEVVTTVTEEVVENNQFISHHSNNITTTSMAMPDMASEYGLQHEQTDNGLEAAEFAVPVAPSECPIAALKSSLPQGDWGFLTEDPEEEQEVKKVWPDSIEG